MNPPAALRRVPVYVVLPPRTLLLDIAGPIEALRRANVVQDRVCFDVGYFGATRSVSSSIGLNLAGVAPLPRRIPAEAMVVVAGNVGQILRPEIGLTRAHRDGGGAEPAPSCSDADLRNEAKIVDWLRATVRHRNTLVTICSGALFAGRAGLFDGRSCTTHYLCYGELADAAPAARVLENRLYVEDGERYSSAGITAGIDLILHLLSRLVDPACALAVARYLVVYLRRNGADPQMSPWLEGRNHIHPAVHRVQDAITADPSRPWTLSALAKIAGASPRHLSRLFNAQVGMNISDYRNRLRAALASELVRYTRLDMERVAERAGFASTRQLRRVWHKLYASPPRDMRNAIR